MMYTAPQKFVQYYDILDGKPILWMDQYSEIKYSGIQPLYSLLPFSLLPSLKDGYKNHQKGKTQ